MRKFFTSKIIVLLIIAVVVMAAGTAVKFGSNPPASRTNAPGEQNCTVCHSGSLNPTPANLNNLTLATNFTGNGYIPDSTYTLTVKYTESGVSRFGFQITALTKVGNNPTGTFTAGSSSSKTTGVISGKTREYLRHNGGLGSSNGKGEWTFTWKAPKTNVGKIVFYVIVNASNSDGGSGGDDIYAKTFEFDPSSLLPVASISANKTNICAGDTIEFTGSGTNSPTAYNWKFKAGNPFVSTLQNPKVVFQIPGTYTDTLRVTNAKGVSEPATVTIVVNSAPVAQIVSVQPNDTVCAGDTVKMAASFGTGFRYKWNTGNPGDTLSNVSITQTGTYTVTVTNSNNCSKTSFPIDIVVKPKLGLSLETANAKDTACEGDSVTFVAQSFSGFDSYTFWRNGNVVQTSSSNTFKTAVALNDTFEVVGTKDGCDSDPSKKILFIQQRLAAPTVSCGTTTTSSIIFNWTTVNGANGYEVSTDTGKTWATPSSGSMGLSHTVTGLNFNTDVQLMVRATDNAPCFSGNAGTRVCKTLSCSGVTFDAQPADTLICPGDSTTITVSNISAPKFSLRLGTGAFGSTTTFTVKPNQTTNFDFELIDSSKLNCPPLQFKVTVKVDNVPTPVLMVTPGTTVCMGQPVQLSAPVVGITKYTVIANGNPSTLTNTTGVFSNVQVNDGDRVAVEIETAAGCKAQSNEETFTVLPLPRVGFTSNINNLSVDFDDTTSSTQVRTWDFGDGNNSTLKNPTHTYATVGSFDVKLTVTDVNGCTDSLTKTITTQNVSIGEIAGLSQLDIYPNPTKGVLQIDFEWLSVGNINLTVTDINGKEVWSDLITQTGKHSRKIDLSEFADGTYLLQLNTPKGQHTLKVLKTK